MLMHTLQWLEDTHTPIHISIYHILSELHSLSLQCSLFRETVILYNSCVLFGNRGICNIAERDISCMLFHSPACVCVKAFNFALHDRALSLTLKMNAVFSLLQGMCFRCNFFFIERYKKKYPKC